MKRYNYDMFRNDLLKYLQELPLSQEMEALQNWISEYDNELENTKKYIIKKFEKEFPDTVVKLEVAPDDSSTLMVEIFGMYGKDIGNNWENPSHQKAWEIAHKIEEEYRESCLGLLIMEKSDKTTKEYYPDIYVKLMEKRKELQNVSKS